MRLVAFSASGCSRLGVLAGSEVLDFNGLRRRTLRNQGHNEYAAAASADAALPPDLGALLAAGKPALDAVASSADSLAGLDDATREQLRREHILLDADAIAYLPPLARSATIFAVGRNYAEHVAEAGVEMPTTTPPVFIRTHNSVVGHAQPVVRPRVSKAFDWEAELAVIIGKPCRYVKPEQALDYVAGYSIFNDGSLRDYQKAAPLLTAGKNFQHSGSFGPAFVTADEVPAPQALKIETRVNGELMQNANTADMIFNIGAIIAYLTEFTTLNPGDVIATGTPAGVGFKRKPPRYLTPGDRVTFEIGNLGVLENPVVDESPS